MLAGKHVAILTAKGGNTTLENKNIIDINGKPSMCWSLIAAQQSQWIDEVFVTTEDAHIAEVGLQYGATIINRPVTLSRPDSNHGDVILHAAKYVAQQFAEDIATVTVLLGNTVMTTAADIDAAIAKTLSRDEIDSCMTVWKAQDDHPLRAMVIDEQGYLSAYLQGVKPDTNRQSYQPVYFYDQGPWTVKYQSLMRSEQTREGPGAWWWMGKRCVAIERTWVTGRDTHTQFDVDIAAWWLDHHRSA